MAIVYTMIVGFGDAEGTTNNVHRNKAILLQLLHENHPDGFTFYESIGCFQGNEEPSATVVFITENLNETETVAFRANLFRTAQEYKVAAQQKEVWITRREEDLKIIK